jgi:hypothetical protein
MKFRPDHLQHIAAAKAGFSERTARRIETHRHLAPQPVAIRGRQGPDPFDGLFDSEIRNVSTTLIQPGLQFKLWCSALVHWHCGLLVVCLWAGPFRVLSIVVLGFRIALRDGSQWNRTMRRRAAGGGDCRYA